MSEQELELLESEPEEYFDYEVTEGRQHFYPKDAKSYRMELWIDAEKVDSRYLEIGVLGKGEKATVVSKHSKKCGAADLGRRKCANPASPGQRFRKYG